SSAFGGGIANVVSATLTLVDSEFTKNSASAGAGGPGADGGDAIGGGLFNATGYTHPIVAPGASATVSSSTFGNNQALGGAAGAGGNGGKGESGGVFNGNQGTLLLNASRITGNTAAGGSGGGGTFFVSAIGEGGGLTTDGFNCHLTV